MTSDERSPKSEIRNPNSDLEPGASEFDVRHSSVSAFRLLLDPPSPGSWNMAVDEALLEAAANEGQSTLRFYRWSEPTLSLGYFQTYGDRFQHEASRDCAVVRRASGGGAILHDIELTYSLAVPEQHPLAATRLKTYRAVHYALIEALAHWGIEAGMLTCATAPPRKACQAGTLARSASEGRTVSDEALTLALSQRERGPIATEPFLCFQRRSPGDVLVGREKIAGSAQRRCRGAVLQHGSLLLARSVAAPELAGLKELTGKAIGADEFTEAWLQELASVLGVTCHRDELPDAHRRRAAAIQSEKYAAVGWTEHRGRGL